MRYIKKPTYVWAEQYNGTNDPFHMVLTHQCDYRMCPICGGSNEKLTYIEPDQFIRPGDFVVNEGGIFNVMKAKDFEKLYEPA